MIVISASRHYDSHHHDPEDTPGRLQNLVIIWPPTAILEVTS